MRDNYLGNGKVNWPLLSTYFFIKRYEWFSSELTQNLWGESILIGKIPYELCKGKSDSYKYLKVWGYLEKIVVLIPKSQN